MKRFKLKHCIWAYLPRSLNNLEVFGVTITSSFLRSLFPNSSKSMETIFCPHFPGHCKLRLNNNLRLCPTKQTRDWKRSLALLVQTSAGKQHRGFTSKDTGKEDTGTWASLCVPHSEFSLMDSTLCFYLLFPIIVIISPATWLVHLRAFPSLLLLVFSAFMLGMIQFHWLHWAVLHWSGGNRYPKIHVWMWTWFSTLGFVLRSFMKVTQQTYCKALH